MEREGNFPGGEAHYFIPYEIKGGVASYTEDQSDRDVRPNGRDHDVMNEMYLNKPETSCLILIRVLLARNFFFQLFPIS